MEDKTIISIVAVSCITVLEAVAIALGFDIVSLLTAIGAIAGIAGYEIRTSQG